MKILDIRENIFDIKKIVTNIFDICEYSHEFVNMFGVQ